MKYLEKLTLLLSTLLLVKLLYTGDLALLIHPRYFWLIYVAIGVLSFILVFDRGRAVMTKKLVAVSVALNVMCIAGIAFELRPLSSLAKQQTNVPTNYNISQYSRSKRETRFTLNTKDRRIQDWVTLMSIDPEPTKYEDQEVRISGFFYYDADQRPAVARYALSCCAADARIISLPLTDGLPYEINDWVSIEGSFFVIETDQGRYAAIDVTDHQPIEIPDDPYVTN